MKTLLAILIVIFLALQFQLWFADDGFFHGFHLRKKIAEQQKKNGLIEESNNYIIKEIDSLKEGGAAIENKARNDLGMVRKGEVFYQVVK